MTVRWERPTWVRRVDLGGYGVPEQRAGGFAVSCVEVAYWNETVALDDTPTSSSGRDQERTGEGVRLGAVMGLERHSFGVL